MSNWLTCVYDDVPDGVDDRRPLILRKQRRMLGPDVGVRRDVAQQRHVEPLGRRAEIFDVAAMQRIERAVHHGDGATVGRELLERQDHDAAVST